MTELLLFEVDVKNVMKGMEEGKGRREKYISTIIFV